MPTNPLIIGSVLFFATVIVGRILSERALDLLTGDEKLKLIEGLASARLRGIVVAAVVVGLAILVGQIRGGNTHLGPVLILTLAVGYMVFSVTTNYRALRKLGLPENYLHAWMFERGVMGIGLLALLAGFWLSPQL